MQRSNLISQLITVLNKAELYPDSEELADVLWLAFQIDIPVIQTKSDLDNEEVISKQENDNKSPPENQNLPKKPPEKPSEIESTKQTQQQKSSLFPHQSNSGINPSGIKGQAFRTPALSLLHNALEFNRAFRPLRKTVASRFHTELGIEETVQYIAETQIFSPILKGKPERWLELVILIDNAISMQIWQPLLKEFRRLLELQGTFAKIHFYQLDTEQETGRVLKNQRVINNFEIINPQQPRLILVVSDCVAKAWHSNQGVFALLQQWSRKHPVSILQMLPFRLWKGTALGYAEEARFTAALPLALNQALNLDRQDFWFVDDISGLEKGFKIPVLTLEPEVVKTWAKLVLGKQDSWLKGVVFDNPAALIPPVESAAEQKAVEITAEQRLKQFKSFASPTAQKLAAYLAAVPLDLSVMNVVQKLMLPQSSQVHLAEVFLGGLLKRVPHHAWLEYEFHAGVRELLLDSVIVADAFFVLTRVSDFVEQRFGQSLDFLALLANPSLTDGIELNESTRPFAEVGAKILKRLGGEYEKLVDVLEGKKIEATTTIPEEIKKQGEAAIKAYFEYSKEPQRHLNELKILFVGNGGAGKTSLSKLLRDQTFDPHENQSHGINIDDWKVGDITAHCWDFGGQEIMRATHKFFLSKRSLYVLVLDNREDRDEERWLKRIESFGGNSPILIVLNKCEQHNSYDVDRRDLVRRYSGLQTQDFYSTSCATGQGIEAFKQGLISSFKRVELINSVLPESWFQVKTALEQQQRQQHYISYDRYIEICREQQIADTQTQDILARLLHDLGVSVHFEDLTLLDTHVLEPKWITEGVYKIITSPKLTEQQGVLHIADLAEILKSKEKDDYIYPPTKYAYLLALMRKFELCYHLNNNTVLIPQLLKPEEPEFTFDDSGQVLRFQFLYDYLDDSIMPRFIVALHQDIDSGIQWRKGVLLHNHSFNSQAVVRVNYQDRLLTVVVMGEQKRDYFAVIRQALHTIHASFEWKKPPVELVPLPDNPDYTIEYEELLAYEQSGTNEYFIGKLRKSYNVLELLNGIEKPEGRQIINIFHNSDFKHGKINALHYIEGNQDYNILGRDININNNAENSLNISKKDFQESKYDIEVKMLLEQLLAEIKYLNNKVPSSQIQQVASMKDDTDTLIKETMRESPRKRWLQFSLEGIKESALTIGEIAKPVIDIAEKIAPFLL